MVSLPEHVQHLHDFAIRKAHEKLTASAEELQSCSMYEVCGDLRRSRGADRQAREAHRRGSDRHDGQRDAGAHPLAASRKGPSGVGIPVLIAY